MSTPGLNPTPTSVNYAVPGSPPRTAYVHKKATASLPQAGYAWIEWDGIDIEEMIYNTERRIYTIHPAAMAELEG